MARVFLSLGSNKGNRFVNILRAILFINSIPRTKIKKISSLYETEPYKVKKQSHFINLVILIQTNLNPSELHKELLRIEKKLGRKSKGDLSAREIDIDILFYSNKIINENKLTIPHKDLHNRKFVLEPLNELSPDFIHPVFKKKIKKLLSYLKENQTINKLK